MRKVTYIEFEAGDPEPAVPYVLDSDEDKWHKAEGRWEWGTLSRTWAGMLENCGRLHAPEELFDLGARAEIEQQIAELEAKAAQLRASLGTPKPRVWTDGGLPVEDGLKVRDREGDGWRQGVDGQLAAGRWYLPDSYAPYTEVLDTP